MKLSELRPQLEAFAASIFSELGVPVIAAAAIRSAPLRVRLGIKLAGHAPEKVLAHLKATPKGAALRVAWPYDTHVVIDPRSEVIAADNESVLLDLTFAGVVHTLES